MCSPQNWSRRSRNATEKFEDFFCRVSVRARPVLWVTGRSRRHGGHHQGVPMRERRVLYTVEEAAQLLGISPSTVHRWAREGELRTIPLSGRMVVPASSLEQLLGNSGGDEPGVGGDENLNHVAIAGRVVA